jgi:hypothetical protein
MNMKNEEIVRALRCISTAGGENACEHCSYWKEEEVPEEERPIYGADTMHSCDVDRVGLDGADLIERLTDRCARYAEEIAVAQERQRWIPVTERLPELQSWGASTVVLGLIKNENAPSLNKLHDLTLCVYCDNGIWSMPGRYAAISHWMPLPDGPEVE